MSYRLVGRAEDQIDRILLESAREWGLERAARYHRLIVGDAPTLPGSREIPQIAGLKSYPLRRARHLVKRELRVGDPRHVVVYRIAPDGVVESLSLVHDRMLLTRGASSSTGS